MRVLGMISGTSHDGIDCAVVNFEGTGEELVASLEYRTSIPYSTSLRSQLLRSLPPAEIALGVVTELDTRIGQEFAEAAAAVIEAAGAVDLICSHGQTVFHWVEGGKAMGSLQIGQPAWIAERVGVPVVADVRARDIAAGGQGAPLVPILDAFLLSDLPGTRAALNLGGISNATIVTDAADPVAFDIGPANALIDAAVKLRDAHPEGFDRDGALAAAGSVDGALLALLLEEPYYAEAPPKTTGKELFHDGYLREMLQRRGTELSSEDLVATLTELTVRTVTDALRDAGVTTVVASGGGARNLTMMEGMRRALPDARILTTDELGIDSDVKEAFAFALIGWLTWHGLPGAVPTATGAKAARVLGSIVPGTAPLELPVPLAAAPATLRLVKATPTRARIRAATEEDLESVTNVFYDCWTITYAATLPERLIATIDAEGAEAMWARVLADETGCVRVVESERGLEGVVGFAMKSEAVGHIRSLYVSPAAQGLGHGRQLIEVAVEELAAAGAEVVTLWVFEQNVPSRRFYQRMGWSPDGERIVDPEFGEPQISLTRRLR